ncbi:MAG: phenylacetate--CoA ligase family protein [Proteobacteria bacterium]|nr:phenylacetate--CoA ligase family protein [Pseudomonadota bacterium]MBU4297126.1 phenylacetate--CoA ligase family protein [Pseudomonadota bacterium]MCG2746548.1 phenylacetate--CoA ligase family protein [Desulfobulbaceae bacterium]
MKKSTVEDIVLTSMNTTGEQFADRAAIERYQFRRLRQTIDHAVAHSPFYRTRMAGTAATDITDHGALSRLPFTYEDDLRRSGQDMLCVSQDEVARIITMQSSGTTGPPKRLFFTEEDLERTIDFFHHGMKSLVKAGQKVLILLPGATADSTGDLLARALERMDVASRIYGLVDDPQQATEEVFAENFDAIVGFPVQLLALSRTLAGQSVTAGQIKSILLCSDYIPRTVCDELSAKWQCRVFSHYGTVETGLGGGVECEGLCGCHLREADLLFEVVCPRTGVSLSSGEWGEIVFSTLTRRGMPLIRYRTGDYGRLLDGPCMCGSHIARLDKVRGRIDQVRQLDNGQALSMDVLDEILLAIPGLLDFQPVLQKENGRDSLTVRLAVIPANRDEVFQQAALLLKGVAQLKNIRVILEASPTGLINKAKRIIEDKRGKISHETAYQAGL